MTNNGQTFLGMGYVNVEFVSGVMRLNVSEDLWFYFVITAPLMVATLSAWWIWELMLRRRAAPQKHDIEKLKDV
jgi:hypothetical protein